MTILFGDKQFEDKKQALNEFAFCHFPVEMKVNGIKMVFEEFSTLENYIENLEQNEKKHIHKT